MSDLELRTITDEDIDKFLEHFGVKGQQWGVRRYNRAQARVNVGKGKGTTGQKLRSYANLGPIDLIKGGGLRGGAARKGARQISRNDRVRAGESSVRDKLAYYGGTRYQDIIPTSRSKKNAKSALGASVAGAVLVSIGIAAAKSAVRGAVK